MLKQIKVNGSYLEGVMMGENFMNTLNQPLEMKDYVSNTSRLENGNRALPLFRRCKARSLTLSFVVFGTTKAEYETRKNNLLNLAYGDSFNLSVDGMPNVVFHLIYTGKGASINEDLNYSGTITLGFDEPNPRNRS